MKRSVLTPLVLLVSIFGVPLCARADGAFPNSMGILLPSDQPNRIIGSTTFGLMVSEDDGASWEWVCEEAIGTNAFIYQQGAAPDDLLLAVSLDGLKFSRDFGCTWEKSGGSLSDALVFDVFPDPTDPLHAYALARQNVRDGGTAPLAVYESHDGARTFGQALFVGSQTLYLSGIENARSDPRMVYVTMYEPQTLHPYIARSTNGGATWETMDLGPSLGAHTVQLLAVDPVNAGRLYLRLVDLTNKNRLAISDDSGATARVVYQLAFPMSAFLRRSDGALIVASVDDGSAFISTDAGASFSRWSNAPHLRALGERNGVLYAVADNFTDGYAVGRSRDQGSTWQGLVQFKQLAGPKECGNLAVVCAGPWDALRTRLGFLPDGGSVAARRGCGCAGAESRGAFPGWGLILVAVFLGMLVLPRRRS